MNRKTKNNWLGDRIRDFSDNMSKLFKKEDDTSTLQRDVLNPQPLGFSTPYGVDRGEKTVQWADTELTDFSKPYAHESGPSTSKPPPIELSCRYFVLSDREEKDSDTSSDLFNPCRTDNRGAKPKYSQPQRFVSTLEHHVGSGESSSAPLAFAGNLAGSSDDISRPSSETIGPTISGKTCPMGLDERLAK